MLHVPRADESGTYCGTTIEQGTGVPCTVCLYLLKQVEDKVKEASVSALRQHRRGTISTATLAIELWQIVSEIEAEVVGVRS